MMFRIVNIFQCYLVITVCFIKLLVVKVIDEVENHGLDDADLEESLANTFRQDCESFANTAQVLNGLSVPNNLFLTTFHHATPQSMTIIIRELDVRRTLRA